MDDISLEATDILGGGLAGTGALLEWGDKNDVILHYEKYEIVIQFELGKRNKK